MARRIEFTVTENGWVTSNAKRTRPTPASRTECKKCGYVLWAMLPSDLWNRYWSENHNCESRQAFNNLMGDPISELSGLSIR